MKPKHNPQKIIQKALQNKPHLPIIEIIWHDAVSLAGDDWATPEEADQHKPAPTISIGYLWNQTDTHITIIALINETHLAHGLTIPKPWIQKIIEHTPPT
jgi:hypothetical protein